MKMVSPWCSFLLLPLGLLGCRSAPAPVAYPPTGEAVRYQVTFTGAWTERSHPLEYPLAGLISGPHFSGLIGASHDQRWSLFAAGRPPSAGLERLSEEGKHSPLDGEIRAALASGAALELFETGPIKDLSSPTAATVQAEVTLDAAHPMVSLAAMVAPSPDWFAGVADVRLLEEGQWVERKELSVFAWDSGGDRGTTYEASDADTDPKDPTVINDSRHFLRDGQRLPVAKVVFTRRRAGARAPDAP